MKFKREYLMKELDLPWDNTVSEGAIDTSRWKVIKEFVFQNTDGKYYMTTYSDWECEDEVECVEVELREVIVKKWVAV